ncbi:sporulation histidine kinase inhibitor Sda [Bacillus sp. THAF10]|uniref:sporulation histidine kinase inhibitor Sda n=1 Tax=Bacillus sp. THAF10 TaxID=2587848 RepID=UPI0020A649EB|nr:sporulation histidine kinase inhibitor Sda [Bacillus sp. THAF10]
MKPTSTVCSCSISNLSDDLLIFAYEHAIQEKLEKHFIDLLETEMKNRRILSTQKLEKFIPSLQKNDTILNR